MLKSEKHTDRMMKSQLTELSRVLSYPTGLRCDIWFSYPPARILRATEGGMEKRRMAQQSRQEYLESHLSAPDRVAEGRSSGSWMRSCGSVDITANMSLGCSIDR